MTEDYRGFKIDKVLTELATDPQFYVIYKEDGSPFTQAKLMVEAYSLIDGELDKPKMH